jgi:hypothetical protein
MEDLEIGEAPDLAGGLPIILTAELPPLLHPELPPELPPELHLALNL